MEKPDNEIIKIYEELKGLYISKNSDYGNSFQEVREEFNNFPVILIRLSDKFKRVKNLLSQKYDCTIENPNNESVEDSLLDLANYAIMEVACMRVDEKEKVKTKEKK